MPTIAADFNAVSEDDRTRLGGLDSRRVLEQSGARAGDWVWLTDGELRVGARLEESAQGMRAFPAWETLEDVIPGGDEGPGPEAIHLAAAELSDLLGRSIRDYREILRKLPEAEAALPEGKAVAIRAMAAQASGYPGLATAIIEEAKAQRREDGYWIEHWLNDLSGNQPARTIQQAEPSMAHPSRPTPRPENSGPGSEGPHAKSHAEILREDTWSKKPPISQSDRGPAGHALVPPLITNPPATAGTR